MEIVLLKHETVNRFDLYVDGISKKNSPVYWNGNANCFEVNIRSYEDVKTISSCRTIELPENVIFNIDILKKTQIDERLRTLSKLSVNNLSFFAKKNLVYVGFRFSPVSFLWNKPYSFAEYLDAFIKESAILSKYNVTTEQQGTKLLVNFETVNSEAVISDLILENSKLSYELHNEIESSIDNKFKREFILASFNFPEELKITCEQYILYFAQFLKDLGINTSSNLKEEAGKVLFSVTPTDDVEALDKIREALAVYLSLPVSPIVYDDSFAAMRLQQQIENLQHSQRMTEREIRSSDRELCLAQTVIESQDKVILQKDTIIEQQNKVIEKITSKSIMMDSLENKAEFEKVFDGLEFGESKELKEKLGIKFNPVISLKAFGRKLTGSKN